MENDNIERGNLKYIDPKEYAARLEWGLNHTMSKYDPRYSKIGNIDFNKMSESELQEFREYADPSWLKEPGWDEPIPLGTRLDPLQGPTQGYPAQGPGEAVLIHYIAGPVDFVRMRCRFTEGTHGQLITGDDPPQVYELHAPETTLILPTTGRVIESPYRIVCRWIFRLPAGTAVWPRVEGWHWIPKDQRTSS